MSPDPESRFDSQTLQPLSLPLAPSARRHGLCRRGRRGVGTGSRGPARTGAGVPRAGGAPRRGKGRLGLRRVPAGPSSSPGKKRKSRQIALLWLLLLRERRLPHFLRRWRNASCESGCPHRRPFPARLSRLPGSGRSAGRPPGAPREGGSSPAGLLGREGRAPRNCLQSLSSVLASGPRSGLLREVHWGGRPTGPSLLSGGGRPPGPSLLSGGGGNAGKLGPGAGTRPRPRPQESPRTL